MAEREGLFKRLGQGFDRYIGGLLGEDLSKMTPEERAAARRSAIGIIGRGMVSPEGGSAALTNVMQMRAAQRERPRIQAAEKERERIAGRLFGEDLGARVITQEEAQRIGNPKLAGTIRPRQNFTNLPATESEGLTEVIPTSRYVADPKDALRRLMGTTAGRDLSAMDPDFARFVQESVTGRTVGGATYNPLTGQYTSPMEAPKLTDDLREYQVARAQGYQGSFVDYQREMKGAGAQRIIFPGQEGEKEYEKIAGKTRFESQDAAFKAAQAAADNLGKVYETLNILETGQPFTGALAETELSIARLKQKLAGREDQRITDTEVLDALLGSEVFAQLSALGVGARGLDTPAEREFLRQVVTGTISLNAETLKKMTEIRANVSNRIIDRYNQRVEKGELDNYFRSMGIPKSTIEKPQRPSAQTIKEGTRAVSIDGRTTAVFRNGRWVDERTGQPIGAR